MTEIGGLALSASHRTMGYHKLRSACRLCTNLDDTGELFSQEVF